MPAPDVSRFLLAVSCGLALFTAGCDRADTGAARSPGAAPGQAGTSATSAGGAATGSAPTPAGTAQAPARGAFHASDITGVDYGKAFELTGADGRPRSLADFRGKAVLLFFGYTSCPDVCPTTLARAVEALKVLGPQASRVQVVFASVDYDHDTPDLADRYAKSFDPAFIGLAGDRVQVARATHDFKVFYQRVPGKDGKSYTIDHTAASYVVDPQGRLRLLVRPAQTPDELADDLRKVLS